MNIKQAADASGVSARNIRYYEQAGLLAPARNPENDYRIYTDADVRTLKLIRVLRTLDMPVEDIRAVLSGTLPLTEAAERQRRQLEAEQQKLAAAAAFCASFIGSKPLSKKPIVPAFLHLQSKAIIPPMDLVSISVLTTGHYLREKRRRCTALSLC